MVRKFENESRWDAMTPMARLESRKRARLYNLTPREMAVLSEMTKGWSDTQIAESLGITKFTVNKHVGSILIKTNSRSRTGAAVRAIREHLVD